ncbi:MAG: ABC transporter permease [Bryobacteraceae bacterium]|jgi:putative ABC transport system permease protein
MMQDLRLGLRTLRKQPGFASIAVFTLALGIGATSAVFSLVHGVLLTPPPYRQPRQLALIQAVRSDGRRTDSPENWAAAQWIDWQKQVKSLDGVAAYNWSFNYLVRAEGSQSVEGMYVTKDYFRIMGIAPVLGRTFFDSETVDGADSVIVLGYEFWQRNFGGNRNAIGSTLRISRHNAPYRIIGVMQPGVRFLPSPGASQEPNYNVNAMVDYFLPAAPGPKQMKARYWDVVGRVKNGVTLSTAQGELKVAVTREAQGEPDFQNLAPHLESLGDEMNRDGRRILFPLLGAAALVLLIACGNAAALLLVRGLQRQGEYAVRAALGIGRLALFRQASMESLLLALTGGALGIGIAFAVVNAFKTIGGHAIPRLDAVTTGWPVLAFGFASATVAAVLAGLYPAMRASRLNPLEALKSAGPKSSASRGERRLLRGVTIVQTALTLALLAGATLLIRTMINISNVQSGYSVGHILTMSVTEVQNGQWLDFHRRALDRVSTMPGVQYAAFAWGVPLTGNSWPSTVEIEGQPLANKDSDRIAMPLRAITQDYFKALGMPMRDGREFRATDDGKQPTVAIVNQAFANRYFPGGKTIGRKVWLNGRERPAMEIIGVVANGRMGDLTQAPSPEIYLSLWQANAFSKHLVVRTTADPGTVRAAVERELRSVDSSVSVENVKTLEQIRADSLAPRNFAMQLLVGFSIVGSVLTLVGIYGVLSLSVASRRREIAIRAAVGAARGDIRNLVLGEAFRLIAGGVIAGVAAAFLLARVLRTFLYGVEATDPVALVGASVAFAAVALLACWAPTRRAGKVHPAEALRYE